MKKQLYCFNCGAHLEKKTVWTEESVGGYKGRYYCSQRCLDRAFFRPSHLDRLIFGKR
jgi:hypothetical protein